MARGQLVLVLGVIVSLQVSVASAQELELSATPTEVVSGQHRAVTLVIRWPGEQPARLGQPRLVCSTGRISTPVSGSPGRWTATYNPPPGNFPRVVLVLASAGSGEEQLFGSILIPIRGRAELPIRTDPGARVTVFVGDDSFGPVMARRDGIARVEVEVPPGVNEVIARSEDPIGNQNERTVPLNLPDYDRLLLLAPNRFVAGTPTTVAALAVARNGTLDRVVELSTSRGSARALPGRVDHLLFELSPPDAVAEGTIEVRALTTDDPENVTGRSIDVVAGPAANIEIQANREALVPGSDQSATVHAVATDRLGNLRPGDLVELWTADRQIDAVSDAEGGVRAVIEAPPTSVGLGTLEVEARAESLRSTLELRLVGGPAQLARIEAPERVVADGRTPVEIRVLLVGPTGLPASETPDLRASAGRLEDLRVGEDGWWTANYVPNRSRLWSRSADTIEVSRGSAHSRAHVDLVPPAPWLTVSLYGGLHTNLRALHSGTGRLEVGSRVRLSRGWLEIAGFTGVSYGESSDEVELGESHLELWQIPFSVGFGYGLTLRQRVGFDINVRGGALLLLIYERTSFQPPSDRIAVAPLVEGTVGLTIRLWRGELVIRTGFAYAATSEGSGLSGNLMGLMAILGYRLFVI